MTADAPYVQAATITAAEGDEETLAAAFGRVVGPTREEPGVLAYELSRSEEEPRRFFFYEVYADRDAAKTHNRSPHVQELGKLPEIGRAKFEIVKYRRLGEDS